MSTEETKALVPDCGISISRIAGGQIAEEWEHFDQLGMLDQLGLLPPPGPGG